MGEKFQPTTGLRSRVRREAWKRKWKLHLVGNYLRLLSLMVWVQCLGIRIHTGRTRIVVSIK